MIKLIHLFKNYYIGISFAGVVAFILQEIPYIIMPLINPVSNPIMNMQNEIPWLEKVQGILGVLSMVFLMLIVKEENTFFSVTTSKEKIFFAAAVLMILLNYVGWIFYYLGYQYSWLIVISQFAAVPLYYLFWGLWKNNYMLVGSTSVFFVIHTINGYLNFLVKK